MHMSPPCILTGGLKKRLNKESGLGFRDLNIAQQTDGKMQYGASKNIIMVNLRHPRGPRPRSFMTAGCENPYMYYSSFTLFDT